MKGCTCKATASAMTVGHDWRRPPRPPGEVRGEGDVNSGAARPRRHHRPQDHRVLPERAPTAFRTTGRLADPNNGNDDPAYIDDYTEAG